jgi:hypothetical protein
MDPEGEDCELVDWEGGEFRRGDSTLTYSLIWIPRILIVVVMKRDNRAKKKEDFN